MTNISMYDSDTGLPQGNGSAKNLAFEEKSYFRRYDENDEASDFFEMIITDVSEQFSEGEARFNVLSDGFVSFATGANPINISIQGWLFVNEENDQRLSFLKRYQDQYRGTEATKIRDLVGDLELLFVLKDTQFKLNLISCQVKENAAIPDYTHVTLAGVAYDYQAQYVPVEYSSDDAEVD